MSDDILRADMNGPDFPDDEYRADILAYFKELFGGKDD